MDEQLKKRLLGGVVLVSLMVIFLPMLLEEDSPLDKPLQQDAIPDRSQERDGFEKNALTLPDAPKPGEAFVQPEVDPPPVFIPPQEQTAVTDLELPVETAKSGQEPRQPLPEVKASPKTAQPETVAAIKPVPAPSDDSWVVQVASLSLKEKADGLIKDLHVHGYRAYLQEANVSGRVWYRVRIGPEPSRPKAETLAARLKVELQSRGLQPTVLHY